MATEEWEFVEINRRCCGQLCCQTLPFKTCTFIHGCIMGMSTIHTHKQSFFKIESYKSCNFSHVKAHVVLFSKLVYSSKTNILLTAQTGSYWRIISLIQIPQWSMSNVFSNHGERPYGKGHYLILYIRALASLNLSILPVHHSALADWRFTNTVSLFEMLKFVLREAKVDWG